MRRLAFLLSCECSYASRELLSGALTLYVSPFRGILGNRGRSGCSDHFTGFGEAQFSRLRYSTPCHSRNLNRNSENDTLDSYASVIGFMVNPGRIFGARAQRAEFSA